MKQKESLFQAVLKNDVNIQGWIVATVKTKCDVINIDVDTDGHEDWTVVLEDGIRLKSCSENFEKVLT